MKLTEILSPSLIKMELEATDKDELFEEMVTLFTRQGLLPDRTVAVSKLKEREAKMTTGITRWVAFPHAKLEGVKNVVAALGISRKGIDYDSLDRQPVYVVLMVFSEIGNPGPHIQLLAETSRIFGTEGFTKSLRQARTAQEVLNLIANEE